MHATRADWGMQAGKPKPTWQVQQAHNVMHQLHGQPGSLHTIGHAIAAVAEDVQPGNVTDASFIIAAAEGVLFEGLASLLRQVCHCQGCHASTSVVLHILLPQGQEWVLTFPVWPHAVRLVLPS